MNPNPKSVQVHQCIEQSQRKDVTTRTTILRGPRAEKTPPSKTAVRPSEPGSLSPRGARTVTPNKFLKVMVTWQGSDDHRYLVVGRNNPNSKR